MSTSGTFKGLFPQNRLTVQYYELTGNFYKGRAEILVATGPAPLAILHASPDRVA